MRQIDFQELSNYTTEARGKIKHIYGHWTGCGYNHVFPDYHINIKPDGTLWTDMDSLTDLKYHTWLRNTGAIGIALCCCNTDSWIDKEGNFSYGEEPPTDVQIDTMAKVVAKLCVEIGLPVSCFMTHAECADIDGYGIHDDDPDMRWDLYGSGWLIRQKAEDYRHDWNV